MSPRRGRPGLIGTMARTAVIAGTATAVSGNVQQKQAAQHQAAQQQAAANAAAQQAQLQAAQQAQLQAAQAQAAPPAPAEDEMLVKLAKLGQMHQAGLIDDTEFAAAKAKVLGI